MTIEKPTAAQQRQLRGLWQEAFGDTEEYLDLFFGTAFSPSRCRCAVEEGAVTAALYWLDCTCRGKKIAYLYAVATAKAFRGRGIATKLMEDTHAHLARLGYAGAVLVPGEGPLFGFYEKLGYRVCSRITDFVCAGSSDEVQLRRVDAADFSKQRREILSLLEPGAVLQEGESMTLLAAQCHFYAGQNFLLAARAEGDVLVGMELLGDPQNAPGIVATLGYREGRFRTRGNARAFAMFRPFTADAVTPTYFGLAFD
jgi:ribosomal protein S18 acetylase RimI-like enzyme